MDKQRAQQFMAKVVGDAGGALGSALVLVGLQTGLFKAMAGAGPLRAAELAERAGIHPRYAQEWLSAMVVNGYVELLAPPAGVADAEADGDGDSDGDGEERFQLPEEHALYLTDSAAETHLGGLFTALPAMFAMLPRLGEAFRSGQGIPFAEYGEAAALAIEQMNRPVYERRLATSWLPTLPDVVARLEAGGRVIDIGCGTGVVPITLARAYPQAQVEGLDLDARSIALARAQAEAAGLAQRVRFHHGPAEQGLAPGAYDLITTFDVIHDLAEPESLLARIRMSLAPGGCYLMVEPRMAHELEQNQTPFGRLLYGMSCLHCVPQSLAQGGPGLGACWGPRRAEAMARGAGFSRFDALPIRSPAMAFYALRA